MYQLKSQLAVLLERFRQRWPEDRRGEMMDQLCDFARDAQGKEPTNQKELQG